MSAHALKTVGDGLPTRTRTTPVAWVAHAQLTLDEWQSQGARLGVVSKSTHWWLGDWVRFGARHFDGRYELASQVTGYDKQTLMNMAYVARRFEISRRREVLSWSHHAELAALTIEDQECWMERAARERLSVRDLRHRLRQSQRLEPTPHNLERVPAPRSRLTDRVETQVICPRCGADFFPASRAPEI